MSGWKRTHNLCVKTGTFTDRDGNEKSRYERIGHIMRGPKDDDRMICIKRTFNPAGLPHDGYDTITLVAFEESDREERRETAGRARQEKRERATGSNDQDFDDGIPF